MNKEKAHRTCICRYFLPGRAEKASVSNNAPLHPCRLPDALPSCTAQKSSPWLGWSMNRVCCLISLFVRAEKSNTTKQTRLRFRRGVLFYLLISWCTMTHGGHGCDSRKEKAHKYSVQHSLVERNTNVHSQQAASLPHPLLQSACSHVYRNLLR